MRHVAEMANTLAMLLQQSGEDYRCPDCCSRQFVYPSGHEHLMKDIIGSPLEDLDEIITPDSLIKCCCRRCHCKFEVRIGEANTRTPDDSKHNDLD